MLWIRVSNPHSDVASIVVKAVVDTGADECVFPGSIARHLGHTLRNGLTRKTVRTASGRTWAYSHTSCIEVLSVRPDGLPGREVLHAQRETPVDFIDGRESFLLGAGNFLRSFVLEIDYPAEVFSLRNPAQRRR